MDNCQFAQACDTYRYILRRTENNPFFKQLNIQTMDTSITMQFVEVDPTTVQRGDTVYVTNHPTKSIPFFVIDVGNPFFLLENSKTHFASLYHAGKMYKLISTTKPSETCQ